jgi:hypothetical protein
MSSLSPNARARDFPILSRRDLCRIEGVQLHPDTDPHDPVVGKGSAEFELFSS